ASADVTSTNFVFRMRMATPSDPRSDVFWDNHALGWELNTSLDGVRSFTAAVFRRSGKLVVVLFSFEGERPQACNGHFGFDGTTVTATFARAVCGVATMFTWSAITSNFGNNNGTIDAAPDHGDTRLTPEHRAGYVMVTTNNLHAGFGNAADLVQPVTSK